MKIIISIIAIAAIILHAIFPNITIDAITIALAFIGIVPWFSKLFEELEFPGGWKIKFRNIENIGKRAEKVGLASEPLSKIEQEKYSFQLIGSSDKNLALAGLRIEIERLLKNIAEKNNIGTSMQGVGRLLQVLSDKELIGFEEKSVLSDMISLLNNAVHGAKIDEKSFEWAMEYGTRVVKNLENRVK